MSGLAPIQFAITSVSTCISAEGRVTLQVDGGVQHATAIRCDLWKNFADQGVPI
jgi:hypothetical protein